MERQEVSAADQFVDNLTEKRADDDDYYPPFSRIDSIYP